MFIRRCWAALFAALLIAPTVRLFAADTPDNTLSDDEKKAGWVLLFDGKTTDGWRNFRKQTISPAWKVVDGTLSKTGNAGDIIATGTPSGVGFARKPPEFMKPGDVVEVEIEKIGVLRNRVVQP